MERYFVDIHFEAVGKRPCPPGAESIPVAFSWIYIPD